MCEQKAQLVKPVTTILDLREVRPQLFVCFNICSTFYSVQYIKCSSDIVKYVLCDSKVSLTEEPGKNSHLTQHFPSAIQSFLVSFRSLI